MQSVSFVKVFPSKNDSVLAAGLSFFLDQSLNSRNACMTVSIFDFADYKSYLKAWVAAQPNKGRGAYTRIAEATGIHSSSLSQIINGDKDFNIDHVIRLGELLALTAIEMDFLIALLILQKSGQEKSRRYWLQKTESLRLKANAISGRVSPEHDLSEEEKALFYSSWLYAAVHLLTSIPEYTNLPAIVQKLNISMAEGERIVDFLLKAGLLVQDKERLQMGKSSTFLPHSSPLIARHHHNWRIQALQRHEKIDPLTEVSYTGPMTLSLEDAQKVRTLVIELSEKVYAVAVPSSAEVMYCLNVDWLRVLP